MKAQSAVKPDPMGSSCHSVDGLTLTFFVYQQAAFTSTVAAAVRLRRGVLSRPLVIDFYTTPVTYPAIRVGYGHFFERAVRMPEHSFLGLVDALRPRLPSRGFRVRCGRPLHCQRRESLVGPAEVMGAGVAVGAGEVGGAVVTVEAGEVLGAGVTVGAGKVVGAGVAVGAGEAVGAGVAVGAGEVVGAGVAVGAGDVLGVRAVCKTAERRRLPLCLSPSRGLIS